MPETPYKHPTPGIFGGLVSALANAHRLRALLRRTVGRLPFPKLASDIRDVVYLTWLVPIERALPLAPPGLTLMQHDGLTPFSILTYAHGHFGPAALGRLRAAMPSPLQSNWRLYLATPPQGATASSVVLFTHNQISNPLFVLGARLFSDTLPAHMPARFMHERRGDRYHTEIRAGAGSALELTATVCTSAQPELPPPFAAMFGSWRQAIAQLALQDAAVITVPHSQRLAFSAIDLPIPLDEIVPAVLEPSTFICPAVEALTPVGEPLCFVVPRVSFTVLSDQLL
jgi:hypothetical protein